MMVHRPQARRRFLFWLLCAALWVAMAVTNSAQSEKGGAEDKRPSLSLRATPVTGFSPARIFLVAEVKGGANDDPEFYCATVEWDWGDETKSQATYDCAPYEPGKSEIRRRYAVEHVFRRSGNYRVQLRLKQKDKVIASASTNVQIRSGAGEIG